VFQVLMSKVENHAISFVRYFNQEQMKNRVNFVKDSRIYEIYFNCVATNLIAKQLS